jgi:hypothetical protein
MPPLLWLIVAGVLLATSCKKEQQTNARSQPIRCVNNLKQISLAFEIWSQDHENRLPFMVSTNAGGTMELCVTNKDGFDLSANRQFQVVAGELRTAKLLVCPYDASKNAATNLENLQTENITYQLRVTPVGGTNAFIVCPVCGAKACYNGKVEGKDEDPHAMRVK